MATLPTIESNAFRFRLPFNSPAMYPEYWNPIKSKSPKANMDGNTVRASGANESPAVVAESNIEPSEVLVNFWKFVENVAGSTKNVPIPMTNAESIAKMQRLESMAWKVRGFANAINATRNVMKVPKIS